MALRYVKIPNIITHVVGETAPTNTNLLWLDTDKTPNVLKYYNGSTWVDINAPVVNKTNSIGDIPGEGDDRLPDVGAVRAYVLANRGTGGTSTGGVSEQDVNTLIDVRTASFASDTELANSWGGNLQDADSSGRRYGLLSASNFPGEESDPGLSASTKNVTFRNITAAGNIIGTANTSNIGIDNDNRFNQIWAKRVNLRGSGLILVRDPGSTLGGIQAGGSGLDIGASTSAFQTVYATRFEGGRHNSAEVRATFHGDLTGDLKKTDGITSDSKITSASGFKGPIEINVSTDEIGTADAPFSNVYAITFDGDLDGNLSKTATSDITANRSINISGSGNKFKGNLDGDLSKDIPEGETDTNIEVNRNLNLASGKQLIGNVNGALYPIIYTNELQLGNSFQVYFSREDKGDKYNGGSVYRIEMTVVSQNPLSPLSDRFIYFSGRLNVTALAIFFTGFSSSWYGSDVSIDGSSYVQKKLVDNSTNTGASRLGSSRTGSKFVGSDLNIEITPIVPEERYVLNQLLFIASPSVNPIDRYTP